MNEIDKTIDLMNQNQMATAFAKSKAKRNHLNIKFMSANQKDSYERAEGIYKVFEKLLKEMLKIWVKDEKTVRLKYLKHLEDSRREVVIKTLNTEIEVVLNQMIKECKPYFEKFGEAETFDIKLRETREIIDNEIKTKIMELQEKINSELSHSEKIEPAELVARYGIDESTLIDLRLIKPLQDMNVKLDKLKENFISMVTGVNETISLCAKYYQKGALKNIILTIKTLVDQAELEQSIRNQEMIYKSWERLISLLRLAPKAEERIDRIQPLHKLFELDEN